MGKCSVCRDSWAGKGTTHCVKCHRTFKTVAGFYRHSLLGDKCLNPFSLGFEMVSGVWVEPKEKAAHSSK